MLILFPVFTYAQAIFQSVPMEGSNLKEQFFYDAGDHTVLIHHFPSAEYIYLLKKDGTVVGTYKTFATTNHRGYSSTDSSLAVYYMSMGKLYAVIFDKASGKATLHKDIEISELRNGDSQWCEFIYRHKFHRLYINGKSNDLSLYVFEGPTAKLAVNMPATENVLKKREEYITFLSDSRALNITEVNPTNQLYWQHDSLVFLFPTNHQQMFISCNLKSKKISTQTLQLPKAKYTDKAYTLVDDKLFVETFESFARSTSFDDSLQIHVFDVKRNFTPLKKLTGNSITGIRWKTMPYISSLGDTVENKWKPQKWNRTLINELEAGFMYVRLEKDGTYGMTLGDQESSTMTAGPAGPGGAMGGGVSITSLGEINSFRTCLSADFQPMPCTQTPDAFEKAAARAYALERTRKSSGGKGRYQDFDIKRFQDCVYLLYVDKEKDTYNVERFLYP